MVLLTAYALAHIAKGESPRRGVSLMWSKWSQLPLWILVLACTSSSAQTVSEPSECSTLMSAADQCILVGPIWVRIRKVTSSIIGYAHADLSTSVEGTTITS